MKADNQRAVEAGIAAWLKWGLCTPALLPRVTGITIQQIPNFWLLRRAFIDFWIVRWPWNVTEAQQRQQYLLGFAESLSYKFQTWIPSCPSQQRGIPSHRTPRAASQGWLLMPGQGYQCLAFPALLFPTPFPHRYFYKVWHFWVKSISSVPRGVTARELT